MRELESTRSILETNGIQTNQEEIMVYIYIYIAVCCCLCLRVCLFTGRIIQLIALHSHYTR